jgi:NAD(P)-dependent dehydrogenase (short-subunit alcohol dehydrogenase family)
MKMHHLRQLPSERPGSLNVWALMVWRPTKCYRLGMTLEGRVAIVTGAGHGLGRAHALLFAQLGARVVVNDVGSAGDGSGSDASAAQLVVDEILALGGTAVANTDDIADWHGGRRVVTQAIDEFGGLDILVNNAGILRDRLVVNMTEGDWDMVVRVHLKGHLAPLHFAAVHWRERSKAGADVNAAVINTSSTSGLLANAGQANYGAAKSGIATLTEIAAKELLRYGVRVNAVAPAARTRLTLGVPALAARVAAPTGDAFDEWDPANVSPVVAWLASPQCPVTGRVFFVQGGHVALYRPWSIESELKRDGRWTVEELDAELRGIVAGSQPVEVS